MEPKGCLDGALALLGLASTVHGSGVEHQDGSLTVSLSEVDIVQECWSVHRHFKASSLLPTPGDLPRKVQGRGYTRLGQIIAIAPKFVRAVINHEVSAPFAKFDLLASNAGACVDLWTF